MTPRVERILRWEFWPYWLFYIPVYFYVVFLGIKERSLTFFTAANPGMEHGGFVEYSKSRIQRFLPDNLVPATVVVKPGTPPGEVFRRVDTAGITFPVVVKPDYGERGLGVAILRTPEDLSSYIGVAPGVTLVQEYVPGSVEIGVLYRRIPGNATGDISSVVVKEQLTVIGDGRRRVIDLLRDSDRGRPYLPALRAHLVGLSVKVPRVGEVIVVSEIGNHCRGATFRDGNTLITDELRKRFDAISANVPGYFFGRYDIKTDSYDAFLRGDFSIIELNGVNSEPGHIYDPGNTIWRAYRDLIAQWSTIATISRENRRRGTSPTPLLALIAAIYRHGRRKKEYHR